MLSPGQLLASEAAMRILADATQQRLLFSERVILTPLAVEGDAD
jgi:hypothetical protein